jgi:carbamate kinase
VRVVIGIGGNALRLRRDPDGSNSEAGRIADAAEMLATLAEGNELVITHGNGPQVGLLALQAMTADPDHPPPLDVLGAESVGMLGYALARELRTHLGDRPVAALLTQVEVDDADPAFRYPTKPIGPTYEHPLAAPETARKYGWEIHPDGDGWRRVVASPPPLRILELDTIQLLLKGGVVTVCAGGGGIPVARDGVGAYYGVEAVVDKDRTTSLLARELRADRLILLTDVDGVYAEWGTDRAARIPEMTVSEARAFQADAGSMGPKIEACADFAEATGSTALLGSLSALPEMRAGTSGTRIVP